MGVQSTRHITRECAKSRIKEISILFQEKNYRKIEEQTYESIVDLQEFVDNWNLVDISKIENWTDKMLGNFIDKPFFRHSMFDNYLISD
uniref:Uncharacterized protein n=1 Tax=viral metagenome TaxID=1070528 RepID=A0A6H1ZDD5_9ZZZZ